MDVAHVRLMWAGLEVAKDWMLGLGGWWLRGDGLEVGAGYSCGEGFRNQ